MSHPTRLNLAADMAEALPPSSSAGPLGSNEPMAGKRHRSSEEESISPETNKQLLDERKKSKSQETNVPNPSDARMLQFEETCVSCAVSDSSMKTIKCQSCEDFHHLICLGVPIDKQESAIEVINLLGWTCHECRNDNRKSFIKMKQDLSSMQTQLDALLARSIAVDESATDGATTEMVSERSQASVPMKPNISSENKTLSDKTEITYSDVVKAIGQAVSDCTRRKRNIIITGISESDSEEDIDVVADLLGYALRMDMYNKIVMMKRIGKIDVNNTIQSRRILVVLDSEAAATEILNRAHLQKDINDPQTNARIYINRDLTPEESKAAYERRQLRRQQLQDNYAPPPGTDREPLQRSGRVYYRSQVNRSTLQPRTYQPATRQASRGGWAREGPTWWEPGRGEWGRGEGVQQGAGGGDGRRGEGSLEGASRSEPALIPQAAMEASGEGVDPTTSIA